MYFKSRTILRDGPWIYYYIHVQNIRCDVLCTMHGRDGSGVSRRHCHFCSLLSDGRCRRRRHAAESVVVLYCKRRAPQPLSPSCLCTPGGACPLRVSSGRNQTSSLSSSSCLYARRLLVYYIVVVVSS